MGLMEDIGSGPIGLDTVVFIYFIEEHPRFLSLIEPVFATMDAGSLEGVTSGVTLLETLVVPFRTGNGLLAERYEALLTRSRGIRLIDLGRSLLRAAAQLRAVTGIKTPDALQVAAALSANCSIYLTNDRKLPRIPGLR
ncbi:MAG: PIN domain-containing protein, partial [Deltaproteobacteria bacterium]|nr:PIN domain-containing protein [Deltaproteobacteria bacterium]